MNVADFLDNLVKTSPVVFPALVVGGLVTMVSVHYYSMRKRMGDPYYRKREEFLESANTDYHLLKPEEFCSKYDIR